MSREQKPNEDGQRRRNNHSSNKGRRFGNRRENVVDSFRWGFVEGAEDDVDAGADEYAPKRQPVKENRNWHSAGSPKTTSKKTPTSVASPAASPLDDDDLNLPSYGRTPIPTDDELPTPRQKRSKTPAQQRHPRQAAKTAPASKNVAEIDVVKSGVVESDSVEPEREKSGRPKREQMVWDPEKREYVPLVVPEPKPRPARQSRRARPEEQAERRAEKRPSESTVAKKPASVKRREEHSESRTPASEPSNARKSDSDTKKSAKPAPEKRVEPPTDDAPQKKARKRSKKSAPESVRSVEEQAIEKPMETRKERRPDRENRPAMRSSAPQRGDVTPPPVKTRNPNPADIEAEATGFAPLGISETMLEALKMIRFIEPTPIQAGVFQQVQAGKDVMGQAQTGTGKTAAFSIPIIEGIEDCPPGNDPVALILVPTRELAVQVRDEAQRLCYGRDVRVSACYGGKPIAKQISRLREGVDIVVGTPGRVLDLMNRSALKLDALRWVVLDEADRMLDIGFRPDIEKILKRTPAERQTLLFSATLPAPVVRLAERYMKSPEVLDFSNKNMSVDTIEQYYVTVDPERKFDALLFLLEEQQPNQAIIFARTKRGVDRLARLLSKRMDSLAAIHGDLGQGERDRVMASFRSGKLRYLVATDVVGRGIDVSGISHIINYDIPAFCDDYVHRVGRTGRMGREGVAYTFVTVEEGSELTRIEMRIDKLLKRAELKGFEAFTKPSDPNANIDDLTSDAPAAEAKPVYGQPTRRIRRAL